MSKLPTNDFYDGFYIWFNPDKKEEYFATPLYLYCTKRNPSNERNQFFLALEQDISNVVPTNHEIVKKYPASFHHFYVEQFGRMLMNLLNADFSSFERAYNSFFFKYGFELLIPYSSDVTLLEQYSSEEELLKNLKNIYKNSLDKLIEIQSHYRSFVDFLYNLNGNTKLQDCDLNAKFIAYLVKHKENAYNYSKNIDVTIESYVYKFHDFSNASLENLVTEMEHSKDILQTSNTYTSKYLCNICFIVLKQFVKNSLLPIKTCKYCGRYFIPSIRQDELYCDLSNVDGKLCREKGAKQTYKDNLEKIPALLEYRKIYQKKFMVVSRSNQDTELKNNFIKWKTKAQAKIKDFKQEKITEEELYQWMIKNR